MTPFAAELASTKKFSVSMTTFETNVLAEMTKQRGAARL